MEEKLLSDVEQIVGTQSPEKTLSLKLFSLARALVVNPSTSDQTISSLVQTLDKTLTTTMINPQDSLIHAITLLSEISNLRPHFSPTIATRLQTLLLHCSDIPPRAAAFALSTLVSISPASDSAVCEMSEGLFLSLCFSPCLPVRFKLLQEADRFNVRPSILLTVFLGFSKDPYPYVRKAALDGLIGLCKSIVVEDRSMIEGCFCRAAELLFDTEESVRCSAIRAVTEWGKLIVASSEGRSKEDWSDVVYVQLCSMVRDMSVNVRVEAFDALGKVGMVSEYILLQTLCKKVLSSTKEKKFPAQVLGKTFNVSAQSAAGAFVHGLEDEFHEVRSSACYSLHMPVSCSANFAVGALSLLMDVLNDDSTVVRLQALKTLHHMAVFGILSVQEPHMHMFLGTVADTNPLIRYAARKVLKLTKLPDLPMFKLAVNSLIQSLDMYPQDEPDVLSVIFNIGRTHGNFSVSIIKEVFPEMEPSSEGNWDFDSPKTTARLVLAISAPLSHGKQQEVYSIPPIIFSYAVTRLGRISLGLTDLMNKNALLAYLSHCSRSTGVFPIDLTTGEDKMLQMVENDLPTENDCQITCPVQLYLTEKNSGSEIQSQGILEVDKSIPDVDGQLEVHNDAYDLVKLILAKIGEMWSLAKLGCISEVLTILRNWNEELATFISDPLQSDCVLTFCLQYLHVVELLLEAWLHVMGPTNLLINGVGDMEFILVELERKLREVRYRFTGFSKEEELHILELILVSCTLRFYTLDSCCCHESSMKKLYSAISRVKLLCKDKDASIELSNFVIELMKALDKTKISTSDGDDNDVFLFEELIELFSLDQFVFFGKFKYMKAEIDIQDNDWSNPLPFVPGLPVGISLQIRVHNTPVDAKLWLRMSLSKDLSQYLFVDLKQFEGSDKIREFTFLAPFYRTPKANSFILGLRMGMECLSEGIQPFRGRSGPKHELVYLCEEIEVFLSMVVK